VKNQDAVNAADDEWSVVCAVEVGGKPSDAYVGEFTYDADFTASNDAPIYELNMDKANWYAGWVSNYDKANYALKDGLNAKKRQTCTAMIELDKETAGSLAGKKYDIKIGARMFDSFEAATASAILPLQDMSYEFPNEQPEMEALDTVARDYQVVIEDTNTLDVTTTSGESGTAATVFSAGIATNPSDDTISDVLFMILETDAPGEMIAPGNILQQWVSYSKTSDTTGTSSTISCLSPILDPLTTRL